MFSNLPSAQRLKLISEPSKLSNFLYKNSEKGCSKENIYSEIDSMNETPSKTPTRILVIISLSISPLEPLSNRRQSNFGLEKYKSYFKHSLKCLRHYPFDQKGSLMGNFVVFGTSTNLCTDSPAYDDILNNNTPIHNPNMTERLSHNQQHNLLAQDFLENRRFSMRNTASVSFTHPELAAAVVDSQEIK